MIITEINNNKERVKGYTLIGYPKTFLFLWYSSIKMKGGLRKNDN